MAKTFLTTSGLCLLSVIAASASVSSSHAKEEASSDHVVLRGQHGQRDLGGGGGGYPGPYNGSHGGNGNGGGGSGQGNGGGGGSGMGGNYYYESSYGNGNGNGNGGGMGGGMAAGGGNYYESSHSGGNGGHNNIGGDRDPYGCLIGAGQSWCASRNQCIGPSERCGGGGGGHNNMPGGDVDQYGCRASAGYEWCAPRNECIRPFETTCGGHSVACPYNYDPVWCGGGNKYLNLCQAEVDGYYESDDCTRYPGDDYYNNVCHLPLDDGDCYYGTPTLAWGYDSYTGYCEEFNWSGCDGNGNRFESRQRCEENCGMGGGHGGGGGGGCGAVYDPVWCSDGYEEFEYSNLCEAVNDGFYENQCMSYPNGGGGGGGHGVVCPANYDPVWCGGNKYSNLCQAVADGYYESDCNRYPGSGGGGGGGGGDYECPQFCYAPRETGNCYANMPKWGYDSQKGRCKEFTYGGCGGNRNNFETEHECENNCSHC